MNAAVAERQAPAGMQEQVDALIARYERHAYLVYNVALLVCADAGAAGRAAERAFAAADVDDLVRAAVHAALEQAPDRPDVPATLPLLATIAQLGKVHRAALALASLANLDAAAIAAVMGTRESAAGDLLENAYRALGRQLGGDAERAAAALEGWEWAAPPREMWQHVYTTFRECAVAPPPPPPPAHAGRRRPRRRRAALVLLVLALAGAGGGYALARHGGRHASPPGPAAAPGDVAAAPAAQPPSVPPADGAGDQPPVVAPNPKVAARARPAKPLTPQELDALRLRELSKLKEYTKRQADHSLPTAQRAAAAREITRLERLAQRRIDVAERREARLRRQLAHERALRARDRARLRAEREQAARAERDRQRTETPSTQQPAPAPPPATTPAAPAQESSCLYNESDGSYICPEG